MITDLYASDSLIKPCVHIKQSLSEHQDFHVFDLMIFWDKSFGVRVFGVRVFVVWP